MIHSFKFRRSGISFRCWFDSDTNTLQIGKSCRGNMVTDIVTISWILSYNEIMSLIASVDSPNRLFRLSACKYFFQLYKFNRLY